MLSPTLAEVPFAAPLTPAAGLGAGALITLLAWLICFTLAYIWRRSFGAMLQWIADEIDKVRLPRVVGGGHVLGPVSSAFRYVDAKVGASLDYAANHTEHAAVWLFNHAAARFDQLGREIGGLAFDVSVWGHNLIHGVIPRELAAAQRVTTRRLDILRARVASAEARVEHVIAHRLSAAEWELDRTEDFFRHGIGRVEGKLERLFRDGRLLRARVHEIEKLLAVAAFTGLLVKSLERLGLRWLRCPSLVNIGRKTGCKGFKLLEELLFGVIDVLVISDLCRITGLMVSVAESSAVKGALHEFVSDFDSLVQCRGWEARPKFAVHETELPARIAWSDLPAVETDLPLAA